MTSLIISGQGVIWANLASVSLTFPTSPGQFLCALYHHAWAFIASTLYGGKSSSIVYSTTKWIILCLYWDFSYQNISLIAELFSFWNYLKENNVITFYFQIFFLILDVKCNYFTGDFFKYHSHFSKACSVHFQGELIFFKKITTFMIFKFNFRQII